MRSGVGAGVGPGPGLGAVCASETVAKATRHAEIQTARMSGAVRMIHLPRLRDLPGVGLRVGRPVMDAVWLGPQSLLNDARGPAPVGPAQSRTRSGVCGRF